MLKRPELEGPYGDIGSHGWSGTLADQEPSHFAHEFSLQLAALLGQACRKTEEFRSWELFQKKGANTSR